MPNTICAVFGCHNSKRKLKLWAEEFCNLHGYNFNVGACDCEPPFRLHVFPSEKVDPDARKRWTKNINRMDSKSGKIWTPTADSRVCSIHFPEGKPTTKDPDPVLHLGHDKIQSVTPTRRKLNRYSDTNVCPPKVTRVDITREEPPEKAKDSGVTSSNTQPSEKPEGSGETSSSTQQEMYSHHILECINLDHSYYQTECYYCKKKDGDMKKIISESFKPKKLDQITMDMKLLKSDEKVKFYTGLPSLECFNLVFEYVKPEVSDMNYWGGDSKKKGSGKKRKSKKRTLTLREEMLMVLMKLRLNLLLEDLADRFSLSSGRISRIFTTWVKVLARVLQPLLRYPSKESILVDLPQCVRKKYPRLRCIIDCTEVYIQRPRDLKVQAATWSDYKRHNTFKVLVGITPRGNISFLSKAWGGRASDRTIVDKSGFLDLIEPFDQIMADKGFTIKEELALRMAELVMPPAAKGNMQMLPDDVLSTKKVANYRIHVERAIQRLKGFRILQETFPITMLSNVDDIVIVCAALTNLKAPLVTGP